MWRFFLVSPLYAGLLLLTLFLAFQNSGNAADIFETGVCFDEIGLKDLCYRKRAWSGVIVIRGEIVKGDAKEFNKIVSEMQVPLQKVILRSPGGNVQEAIEIGNTIRQLKAATAGPSLDRNGNETCGESGKKGNKYCLCASACFLIYAGGYEREMSSVLMHRPYIEREKNKLLTESESQSATEMIETRVKEYLSSMGIPEKYIAMMMNTPSTTAKRISYFDMKDDIVGFSKPIEEWFYAKCKVPPSPQLYQFMDTMSDSEYRARFDKALYCRDVEYEKLRESAFTDWNKKGFNR